MLTPEAVLPSLRLGGADLWFGERSVLEQELGPQREHPRRRRGHDPAESEPFGVFHGSPSAASASSASRLSSQKR